MARNRKRAVEKVVEMSEKGRKQRAGLTSSRAKTINHPDPREDEAPAANGETKLTDAEWSEPHMAEPMQEQAPLLAGTDSVPKVAEVVQEGRILATFVAPHFDLDKDGERLCSLEFSFPLEEAHRGMLPANVEAAWDYVLSGRSNNVGVLGVEMHTIEIFLAPKEMEVQLRLAGATIQRPAVKIVEENGKGKTVKKIRYSFRALVGLDEETGHFVMWNYGGQFWIAMGETQAKLI